MYLSIPLPVPPSVARARLHRSFIILQSTMGACCSKKHLTKKKAFHQELGAPLLDALAPELGKNAKVIVLRLVALKHITSTSQYGKDANAFVKFRLLPGDEVGGDQDQSSTIIPSSSSPMWVSQSYFPRCITMLKYN